MRKFLSVIVVLLLIVVGASWYFLSFRLDGIIENRIEMAGRQALGSQVSVGSVETNIRDGSLTISEITVANPPGFENPNAFSLENIHAAVDYRSLDVKRVIIDNPEIVIEEVGGRTNFDAMLDALEKNSDRPPEASAGEEPVIVLHHFRMNESRAGFESKSLDRYTDVEIDAVELNDLRGTPTELARVIGAEILKEVTREAATEVLKAQASKKYDEVEEKVTEKLRNLLGDDKSDN